MNKTYAGIGSRKTPEKILLQMEKIGALLASKGYTLRSGGAVGADSAFERGCDSAQGSKQIWHPSESYFPLHEWATDKASETCWEYPLEKMKAHTISLITRNMYQIFGDDEYALQPVDFVLFWSEGDPLEKGFEAGGTRYAIRACKSAGIPAYNLRTDKEQIAKLLLQIK